MRYNNLFLTNTRLIAGKYSLYHFPLKNTNHIIEEFMSKNHLYTHMNINETMLQRKKDGILQSDKFDNPAQILFNRISIFRLTWFHNGKMFRSKNCEKLPADIGFHRNGSLWYDAYYNEDEKLESFSDNPAMKLYYPKNRSKYCDIFADNGNITKSIVYDPNGNVVSIKKY